MNVLPHVASDCFTRCQRTVQRHRVSCSSRLGAHQVRPIMLVQPCQLHKSCPYSGVTFLRLVQHGSCKSPREVLGNLCTEVHGNLASRLREVELRCNLLALFRRAACRPPDVDACDVAREASAVTTKARHHGAHALQGEHRIAAGCPGCRDIWLLPYPYEMPC